MELSIFAQIDLKAEMLLANFLLSKFQILLITFRQLEEAIFSNQYARCVILKSSTPGMFCAGADLKERKQMAPEEVPLFLNHLNRTFNSFEALPCPTIAVIDGPALGGGLELSLCSDIRIATKDALLGLTETSLAIIPGAGGTQRCPRLIGVAKAKELIFTADKFKGEKALKLGLINHLAENREEAEKIAMDIAEKIGANGPLAVRAAKQAISYGINMDLKSGLEFEQACYAKLFHTEDRLEALKAFAEKRKPDFKGK